MALSLAHCALSSSFQPSIRNSIRTRKPLSSLSSPSKPTKRKNHLRSKLLKTLTKPHLTTLSPQQIPENPNKSLEIPQEQEFNINSSQNFGEIPSLNEQEEQNEQGLQNLQVSASINEAEDALTTRSVIELVFYIVGLFIVQTIITVLVLRSNDKDTITKSENEEELVNGKKKEGFWFTRSAEVKPDSVIYVDESQFKEKIVEIRAMAKEVREIEAKKLSSSSDEIRVDEDASVSKPVVTKINTNIQKEVDGKLSKLEKRLGSVRDKSLKSKVSYLNNSDEVKDNKAIEHLDSTEVKDENLMFKKKMKFKSTKIVPSKPGRNPKGFQSDKSHSAINENSKGTTPQNTAYGSGKDGNNVPNAGSLGSKPENKEQAHLSLNSSLGKTVSKLGRKEGEMDSASKKLGSAQDIGRKSQKEGRHLKSWKEMKIEKIKSRSGVALERTDELVESKDSMKIKTNRSPVLNRHVGDEQVVNNSGDKRASIENDVWWLNLPYALAILLRRTSESEGPGGLYSLKMDDDGSPSHIVAFEDQRDASNFCYILEAFFDELGDLVADVVPLSIKELKDEVEARAMNVIVVRKGQLQLYAGQPLADVEMTLRTLVR